MKSRHERRCLWIHLYRTIAIKSQESQVSRYVSDVYIANDPQLLPCLTSTRALARLLAGAPAVVAPVTGRSKAMAKPPQRIPVPSKDGDLGRDRRWEVGRSGGGRLVKNAALAALFRGKKRQTCSWFVSGVWWQWLQMPNHMSTQTLTVT